jgi:hypothetical protein
MEPEGSSPHSQVITTCLYPEPAQSSPHPHILPQTNNTEKNLILKFQALLYVQAR